MLDVCAHDNEARYYDDRNRLISLGPVHFNKKHKTHEVYMYDNDNQMKIGYKKYNIGIECVYDGSTSEEENICGCMLCETIKYRVDFTKRHPNNMPCNWENEKIRRERLGERCLSPDTMDWINKKLL